MKSATQGGFTLIEIMVAVALLAILSAIAVQAYVGYIEEAKIGTAAKDIRQAEIILDDLAADNALAAIDGGDTSVRGIYLATGGLRLADPGTTPPGTTPWVDPWDRIYRYQRNGVDGVMRDAAGGISNDATNSSLPQSYDIFSLGDDGTAGTSDDVVRGCNGGFLGLRGDHPSC